MRNKDWLYSLIVFGGWAALAIGSLALLNFLLPDVGV